MNGDGKDIMNKDNRMGKDMMIESVHLQESDILASFCVVIF